ncbi:MAG: hypothetical protein HY868_19755 [Chloroflexi bacterium]|nr:hypothetical protein [Chloroflexota bacterium]
MHLNDGDLRAARDNEADARTLQHLAACAICRARADELAAQAHRVAAHFDALTPQVTRELSAPVALARFKSSRMEERKESMFGKLFHPRFRVAWAMAVVVALLAVSLTLPPVQTWAEGMLAQFRVKNIVVLPVDTTGLSNLNGDSTLARELSKVVADSVTVTKEPAAPRVVANAAEASKLAGFSVRLPTTRSDAPRLTVRDGSAFEFVVNRARVQSWLNEAGLSKTPLPASLDKANIKVSIPTGVTAEYGDCPKPDSKDAPRRATNCVMLTQIPSPVVDTPPNVDLLQLAEIGLQFTGMTKEQAQAYAKSVDWTSTLVVPIPRNAASHKQVPVDGATGNLIESRVYGAQYALIWTKNNIVYAVATMGTDASAALTLANSLK